MINTTSKALEYVALHQGENISKLKKKISREQINLIIDSKIFSFNMGRYLLTEKGKEVCTNYFEGENNFAGF